MFELDADALALGRLDVFGLLHHHVGIHHDQPAVGVVDEPLVARLLDQAGNRRRAEADVQDGLHHAGHRGAGAAAAAQQQRVLGVAELHAHRRFRLLQGGGHFVAERLRELPSLGEKDRAELGADRESGGNGQVELGHLGEVRPLAAERVFHRRIAFGSLRAEEVNVLLSHFCLPSSDVTKKCAIVPLYFLAMQFPRLPGSLQFRRYIPRPRTKQKSLSAGQKGVKDQSARQRCEAVARFGTVRIDPSSTILWRDRQACRHPTAHVQGVSHVFSSESRCSAGSHRA